MSFMKEAHCTRSDRLRKVPLRHRCSRRFDTLCPRWHKVDPHRSQMSDVFLNGCEQRRTEVVDTPDKAKEQKNKVQHHAQMFEPMLDDVLANVRKNSSLFSGWSLSDAACDRAQSRDLRGLPQWQHRKSSLHDTRVTNIAQFKTTAHADKMHAR